MLKLKSYVLRSVTYDIWTTLGNIHKHLLKSNHHEHIHIVGDHIIKVEKGEHGTTLYLESTE